LEIINRFGHFQALDGAAGAPGAGGLAISFLSSRASFSMSISAEQFP